MKKLLGIIGPSEFKNKIESLLEKELAGCINADHELESILSEVYRTTPDKFKGPVQIKESDMRIFFLKMFRGTHAVKSGPTFDTFAQLKDFYKNKVGEEKFGKDWTLVSLKDKLGDLTTGVYLVQGLSDKEIVRAKNLLEDSFLVVQIVPELPKPKKGEPREKAEVLKETDITVTEKQTEDGIKREFSKLLQQIKIQEKEKIKNVKPGLRIAQRQFRPWDA